MSGHGGRRAGSGRPRKWSFFEVLNIGQACEVKWREASKGALSARYDALPRAAEITALYDGARAIPVEKRAQWVKSDAFEDHVLDLESHLHAQSETPFDYESGTYMGAAPRLVRLSTKPFKGTRERIIQEVASANGLSPSQVDNLWQAYRRLERSIQNES